MITEDELKLMEENEDAGEAFENTTRLIAEVRRLRALESYGVESNWIGGTDTYEPLPGCWRVAFFVPPHPDYRNEPGYKLAREALGWGPPPEPCDNPKCDGVKEPDHRCFKDGYWLDDNSPM